MPISINLLAEAQAAEDLRRRDPVKRGIWLGGFLIFLVVLWIGTLQVAIFQANSGLKGYEAKWKSMEQKFKEVAGNANKVRRINARIEALDRLSTNRFLWGSVLNSLQANMVENITVTRLKTEQTFANVDEIKAKTNIIDTFTNVIPRVPSAAIEKVALTISAVDSSPNEQNYNKFKDTLSSSEYFRKFLKPQEGFTFSGTLSAPTSDPANPGRVFISFALESHFREARRSE